MTHTPAVDSLEQVVADMRAKYFRNSIEHEFADRIAALARPPGGSERLRERIELAADKLGAMLQGWSGSTADTRDALTAELRDIARLASPQGAEQRQEGWQTVPRNANGLVIDSIRTQLGCDTESAQRFWDKLLYWATPHPDQADDQRQELDVYEDAQAASQGDESAPKPVAFLRDMLAELRLERHTLRNQWRIEALEVAIAALSSPPGVQAAQVSELLGLARLWEQTERGRPTQFDRGYEQASRECADALRSTPAQPGGAAHGGEDAEDHDAWAERDWSNE